MGTVWARVRFAMLLASIGWSATLLTACGSSTITGSGRITSTPVPVSSFTRIQVADAFSVVLKRGQTDQVVVRVDDNLVDELDVGVSNGTLRLALKPNLSIQRATLQANVTVKDLAGVELSGASSVLVSDLVTAQRLTVAMSGASQFRGNIMAKQADLRLSGGSRATVEGFVPRLGVTESGASDLTATGLQAQHLSIELTGASSATVTVSGTISAVASGASSLRYAGTPRFVRRDVSGGSSISAL